MTMMEVIKQLQAQGHEIDFYMRKDGGILIKKIDSERYPTGAAGNAVARAMIGSSLSEARVSQLKYATRAKKARRKYESLSIDNTIAKEYKRVKKIWNKHFKANKGKPHSAGYFGWARITYAIEHYGKKEALRRISEAERYTSGLAYTKNVQHLADYVRLVATSKGSQELAQLADDIENSAWSIREEWIVPAYDALYLLNKGWSPKEVAAKTRTILRL